jgi:hypothetical protein
MPRRVTRPFRRLSNSTPPPAEYMLQFYLSDAALSLNDGPCWYSPAPAAKPNEGRSDGAASSICREERGWAAHWLVCNKWIELGTAVCKLGAEASAVMALRGAKFANGGAAALQEAERMITEKSRASLDFGCAMATGRMGSTPERVARYALLYGRRRVRANLRRLAIERSERYGLG